MSDTNINDKSTSITLGCMVEVGRRCWPGMNKPGGFAMVKRLHRLEGDVGNPESNRMESEHVTHVDVWYPVENRKENRVPVEYVKVASDLMPFGNDAVNGEGDGHGRRKRNTLGRCTRCHSLRQDCGSCDWKMEEERLEDFSRKDSTVGALKKRKKKKRRKVVKQARTSTTYMIGTFSDENNSLSSDPSDNELSFDFDKSLPQKLGTRDQSDLTDQEISSEEDDDLLGFIPFSNANETKTMAQREKVHKKVGNTSVLERIGESLMNTGSVQKIKMDAKSSTVVQNAVMSGNKIGHIDILENGAITLPLEVGHEVAEFIQPEGDPNQLPVDIADRSKDVKYETLPDLFDEIVGNLEVSMIPDVGIALASIKRKVNGKENEVNTLKNEW